MGIFLDHIVYFLRPYNLVDSTDIMKRTSCSVFPVIPRVIYKAGIVYVDEKGIMAAFNCPFY